MVSQELLWDGNVLSPQVSSVNLRTDGWTSPLLHHIGVSVSNAGLVNYSLSLGGCALLCVPFFFSVFH